MLRSARLSLAQLPLSCTLSRRFQSTISKNHLFTNINSIPKDKSQVPTHELLQKLGFVKQPSAGLVHWLPLGLKTVQKISNVIRRRMNDVDFEEVSLSSLSGAGLWEKTGRWSNTELFKLQDAKKSNLCLVATCEEEITDIVNKGVQSYKQLPVLVYQITRKYRDEKRPRFGLLRGREFIMKDGYSFHADAESAIKTFEDVNGAYRKIFQDLKVPFMAAKADSGDIGGDMSLEWHFLHSSGEDTLMHCDSCRHVSNVEKTVSLPTEDTKPVKEATVRYFTNTNNDTLIALYYPKNRTLVPNMAKAEIEDIDITEHLSNDQVIEKFNNTRTNDNNEDIAVKSVIRVMDPRITSETLLPDFPSSVAFQRNSFTTFNDISIVEAQEGELCGDCNEGHLHASNAIEVAHTFYLGKRYSEPLNAGFKDSNSAPQLFEMGCYGIGVSRLLAAVAEVLRDGKGLVWPASIAPYHVTVIPGKNMITNEVTFDIKNFVGELRDGGMDVQKDTRTDLSLPFRIRESQIIGVPLAIIVGEKYYPNFEIEVRARPFAKSGEKAAWESLYEEKKNEWNWSVTVEKNGNEKHFVHKDFVAGVVKALLKDM